MKAVRVHSYGDVGVLAYEDAPVPIPGPDEILVKVHTAAVNYIDTVVRRGFLKELGHRLPLVPGWDFSGTVEVAGSLVRDFKTGDRVFTRPDLVRDGGYAEYVAVRADEVAHVPPRLALREAATVPHASLTAWKGLFEVGQLKAGQRVLIHAAAGGVGWAAVQLAKLAGAYVVATASGANVERVKALGADRVVDYKNEDFTAGLKDLDLVLDTVSGETRARSWDLLRRGGILASTLRQIDRAEAEKRGVQGLEVLNAANGARLQNISRLIEEEKLVPVQIGREFPLSEAAAAQQLVVAGGAGGKILLRIG